MNSPKALPAAPVAEFGRLNDAERHALRLLAEGHTAKSIAAATGCSPAAVNERLREARRKTGIGSSRELARLLRAQEYRHERTGLEPAAPADAATAATVPHKAARGGAIIMSLFLIGGIVAAVALSPSFRAAPISVPQTTPATQATAPDELLGGPLEPSPDAARMHLLVRSEPRDAAWAPATEAALTRAYSHIRPLGGGDGAAPRVTCAASLCEVAGFIDLPQPESKDPKAHQALNDVMQALQGETLRGEVAKMGLEHRIGLFTSSVGAPKRSVFFTYWSRAKS